jgi:hypothetical protein
MPDLATLDPATKVEVTTDLLTELAAAVFAAGDVLDYLESNNDPNELFFLLGERVIREVFWFDPDCTDDEWERFPARVVIEARAEEIEADALDLTGDRPFRYASRSAAVNRPGPISQPGRCYLPRGCKRGTIPYRRPLHRRAGSKPPRLPSARRVKRRLERQAPRHSWRTAE